MTCLHPSRLYDCSFQGHGSYDERTEEANIVTPFLGHAPELVKILRRSHLSRSKEAWKRVQRESFAIVMHKVIDARRCISSSELRHLYPHSLAKSVLIDSQKHSNQLPERGLFAMCLLFHYSYRCHPSKPETLLLPCHHHPLISNESRIAVPEEPKESRICPRLWKKEISSPHCVGCLARLSRHGIALREREKECM